MFLYGLKYRRFAGCPWWRFCLFCRYRVQCLYDTYDSMVVVLPDGTHSYSRKEARERGLLDE